MGFFFIKIGQYKHLRDLQRKGELYCNTLSFFAKCDAENGIGDPYEDVLEIFRPIKGELYIGKKGTPVNELRKTELQVTEVKKSFSRNPGNIFSLYTYETPSNYQLGKSFKIFPPAIGSGDYCLFILNPAVFLRQVKNAIERIGLAAIMKFVDYRSLEGYLVKKDFFTKDIKYSYQREYRIYIENRSSAPFIIKIGSIANITQLVPFSKLLTLDFKFDNGPGDQIWLQSQKF